MKQEIRLEPYFGHAVDGGRGSGPDLELRPFDGVAFPFSDTGLHVAPALQRFLKRATDVIASLAGLVLLAPLFLVAAVLVKLTSSGPAFFVQRRVGRDGRPFSMVKFRSMYRDAPDRRSEHADRNIHGVGPVFKIKGDPRVTPVGCALRRLSIDELPQLINVLIGNMSLVGPRPCLPEEFLDYGERERQRLLVKPGLTCIWQVSGRSDVDFDTWVDMDLQYIASWSLLLDLKLLALTLPAVLTGRGAY